MAHEYFSRFPNQQGTRFDSGFRKGDSCQPDGTAAAFRLVGKTATRHAREQNLRNLSAEEIRGLLRRAELRGMNFGELKAGIEGGFRDGERVSAGSTLKAESQRASKTGISGLDSKGWERRGKGW